MDKRKCCCCRCHRPHMHAMGLIYCIHLFQQGMSPSIPVHVRTGPFVLYVWVLYNAKNNDCHCFLLFPGSISTRTQSYHHPGYNNNNKISLQQLYHIQRMVHDKLPPPFLAEGALEPTTIPSFNI